MRDMNNSIEMYTSPDNQTEISVLFEGETVWLTQQQMALLFGQTKQNVSLHISNIFKEEELTADSVVKDSLTTAADGKKYKTKFYNLDVIISVGFRVKSVRGTRFRQWATRRLKEFLVQGYALNEPPQVHSSISSSVRSCRVCRTVRIYTTLGAIR